MNTEYRSAYWGQEGCDNPYDLGWKHGTEDISSSFKYRNPSTINSRDLQEYKEGYKDARRGWDNE